MNKMYYKIINDVMTHVTIHFYTHATKIESLFSLQHTAVFVLNHDKISYTVCNHAIFFNYKNLYFISSYPQQNFPTLQQMCLSKTYCHSLVIF